MGEDTSYHIKNANLIERLEGVPDEKRTARFVCAIAAAFPDGTMKTVRAAMEGRIGYKESEEMVFGMTDLLSSGIRLYFCRTFHGRKK